MLTEKSYNSLTESTFSNVLGRSIDTFEDYCLRECYFQDYLDLFRGENTRGARKFHDCTEFDCENGHTYFNEYKGAKCLWDLLKEDLKKKIEEFPELKEKLQKGFPKIKYILIAEAPTHSTYFYNPNHIEKTPYFYAVANAFCIKTSHTKKAMTSKYELVENKEIILIILALQGVLLLDLFPFVLGKISSKQRHRFNTLNIPDDYWQGGTNPYSIKSRLAVLRGEYILHSEIKACFIAPNIISHHIANNICNTGILSKLDLMIKCSIAGPLRCSSKPIYDSCACSKSGFPNDSRIKFAL